MIGIAKLSEADISEIASNTEGKFNSTEQMLASQFLLKVKEMESRNSSLSDRMGELLLEREKRGCYKPCLVCRIKGHKWWITDLKECLDTEGNKHRDRTHKPWPHCDRCGAPNPSFQYDR